MNVPYKVIMVPLDGSDRSEKALRHAELLAEQFGSELLLFQAVPEVDILFQIADTGVPQASSGESMQRAMLDQATEYLDAHATGLDRRNLKTRVIVDVGDPADKIIDNAAALDADLLVINTHGRSGLARWTYGSVAAKVLEAAPCPVLLVREAL